MVKKKDNYNQIYLNKKERFAWNSLIIAMFFSMAFFTIIFSKAYQKYVDDGLDRMELRTNSISLELESYFYARLAQLDFFANQEEIKSMDPDTQKAFLEANDYYDYFEELFIMTADGQGYYFSEGVVRDQSKEIFAYDVIHNKHYVTDPFIRAGLHGAVPTATLSSVILSERGEVLGAVCGVIELTEVYNSILENAADDATLTVVSRSGNYIIDRNMNLVNKKKNIYDTYADSVTVTAFLEKALEADEPISDIVKYNNIEYCISVCNVEYCNWKVGMISEKDTIVQGISILFRVFLFIIVCMTVFIILTIYLKHKSRENEIRSYTDRLTGLNNAAHCHQVMDILEKNVTENIMIVTFDLNDFKKINDTLGHQVGDEAIIEFSKCIRNSFGREGFVGRMGGDEFIALLQGDVEKKYETALAQLKTGINHRNSNPNKKYTLSVSYGYSTRMVDRDDVLDRRMSTLYKEADERMYEFKAEIKRQTNATQ